MPPKSSIKSKDQLPFLIKFKRQSQTIMLSIPPTHTLKQIKEELIIAINETGGLKLNNPPLQLTEDGEILDDEEAGYELDDLDIPKPSFDIDDSDSDSEDPKGKMDEDDTGVDSDDTIATIPATTADSKGKNVRVKLNDPNDIEFALPNDKFNPYDSGFTAFQFNDDTKITGLGLADFATVSFKVGESDEFKVEKPSIEEED